MRYQGSQAEERDGGRRDAYSLPPRLIFLRGAHRPLTMLLSHLFFVSLSLHSNGCSMGQEFCVFGSQLFSCKCPVSIYSHEWNTLCLASLPMSPACPLGRDFILAAVAALPCPPQAPARRQASSHSRFPREGERRCIPIGDGGRVGGTQWQSQTHPESNLFSLLHPNPWGPAVTLSPPGSLQQPPPRSQAHPVRQQVLSLLCLKPSGGSHLTQKK